MEPTLITREEAMNLLRVSRNTLIRLERKGIVKAVRLSDRKVLYDLEEIKRLIEDLKTKSNQHRSV
ncbi:MAG: helix-turn-helix domain-containing protein [Candidatus Methanomethylicaceae archaeon]